MLAGFFFARKNLDISGHVQVYSSFTRTFKPFRTVATMLQSPNLDLDFRVIIWSYLRVDGTAYGLVLRVDWLVMYGLKTV